MIPDKEIEEQIAENIIEQNLFSPAGSVSPGW